MNTARDLGRIEPWQDSLGRSLARRGKESRPSIEPTQQPERHSNRTGTQKAEPHARTQTAELHARTRLVELHAGTQLVELHAGTQLAERSDRTRPARRRRRAVQRRRLLTAGASLTSMVLAAGALPSLFGGHSGAAASTTTKVADITLPPAQFSVDLGQTRALGAAPPAKGTPHCGGAAPASAYVNPLASTHLTPERIDQGVDYAGSGMLAALGYGQVTYVGTAGTGWPGAFIEYRLLDGPDYGCLVYYAEGVQPVRGLRVGQRVHAGEPVATIISGWPTGIELGWGAAQATETYAMENHSWTDNADAHDVATPAGRDFSSLIGSLGGKPGKVEG